LQGQEEHFGISILFSDTITRVTRRARRVGGRRWWAFNQNRTRWLQEKL